MKKLQMNKELELAKELLDINKKRIAQIDDDVKSIEQRYKSLMELELSTLNTERSNRMSIVESMEKVVGTISCKQMAAETPATPEEAMPCTPEGPVHDEKPTPEQTVDEEPIIQDTLFPENNEPETENQAESENESAPDPIEEQAEPLSESDAVSTDEDGFAFGDEQNGQEATDDDDNWPDMPTEWQ